MWVLPTCKLYLEKIMNTYPGPADIPEIINIPNCAGSKFHGPRSRDIALMEGPNLSCQNGFSSFHNASVMITIVLSFLSCCIQDYHGVSRYVQCIRVHPKRFSQPGLFKPPGRQPPNSRPSPRAPGLPDGLAGSRVRTHPNASLRVAT